MVAETEDILENPKETAFQIEMETLKQVEDLSERCVAVGILNKVSGESRKNDINLMCLEYSHLYYISKKLVVHCSMF